MHAQAKVSEGSQHPARGAGGCRSCEMINALLHVTLILGGEEAMVLDLLAKRVRNVLRHFV